MLSLSVILALTLTSRFCNVPASAQAALPSYQLPQTACGPASLYWALRYFDRPASFEDLRQGCKDTRGCSIGEICTMARIAGMAYKVITVKTCQLPQLRIPAIVLFKPNNSEVGHFCFVVAGSVGTFVYADPMSSVHHVDLKDLPPDYLEQSHPAILLSADEDAVAEAAGLLHPTLVNPTHGVPDWALGSSSIAGALLFGTSIIRQAKRAARKRQN